MKCCCLNGICNCVHNIFNFVLLEGHFVLNTIPNMLFFSSYCVHNITFTNVLLLGSDCIIYGFQYTVFPLKTDTAILKSQFI